MTIGPFSEFSSMDSARTHEPVSVLGIRLHILTNGCTFDIRSRVAAHAGAAAAT